MDAYHHKTASDNPRYIRLGFASLICCIPTLLGCVNDWQERKIPCDFTIDSQTSTWQDLPLDKPSATVAGPNVSGNRNFGRRARGNLEGAVGYAYQAVLETSSVIFKCVALFYGATPEIFQEREEFANPFY